MAPTLRYSRDFGTSKYQLKEENTPFRTIAEDRNAIRAGAPSLVGEMGVSQKGGRDALFPAQVARVRLGADSE
jgi:hypothetical protein